MLQSNDGKHDEALKTSLSSLAVGRSIGQEPFLMSTLVRLGVQTDAIKDVERCLANGTISDDLLAEVQRQLASEVTELVLEYGIRGERGGMHSLMKEIEAGTIDLEAFGAKKKRAPSGFTPGLWLYAASGGLKKDAAWMLRFHNQAVEFAKLPCPEMRAGFNDLELSLLDAPLLSKLFCPALTRVGERAATAHGLLECANAGIAAERFRLRNGHLPESLDQLVAAKLLDAIPIDPFDGQPLRYRKASDGVVVYSIGEYGNYGGDALDAGQPFDPNFTRIEFRVWDEAHRRQPPRARPKDDDKDG